MSRVVWAQMQVREACSVIYSLCGMKNEDLEEIIGRAAHQGRAEYF
jgi:hypothetical protein